MSALFEAVWLALRSVARSGLRSFLTMLGVLIGVAAVVVDDVPGTVQALTATAASSA